MEFTGFPKIARFNRDVVVTEKLDGTNSSIYIPADGRMAGFRCGSRNRWITPDDDNYGFARWCYSHLDELELLGPGHHFGEWWGGGIQRGYGLAKDDKRFSLFNTVRWCLHGSEPKQIPTGGPRIVKKQDMLPACVGLVPVLYSGPMMHMFPDLIMQDLKDNGSDAVCGYMNPEGIVIFHTAANIAFKMTFDDKHKGA